MSLKLLEPEYKVLVTLYDDASDTLSVNALVSATGLDQAEIVGAASKLAAKEFVEVKEIELFQYSLGKEGERFALEGFPEKRLLSELEKQGGSAQMSHITQAFPKEVAAVAIQWVLRKKWCSRKGEFMEITDAGWEAMDREGEDEKLVKLLRVGRTMKPEELEGKVNLQDAIKLLQRRPGVLEEKVRVKREIHLTKAGYKAVITGIEQYEMVSQLTPHLISSGKWKDVEIKPYDINLDTAPVYPGKIHPLQKIIEETRRVYLELGFTEIASPHAESAFWDFDALFQPQDHPARDMQDTFYVANPHTAKLPSDDVVDRVKKTHEDGGESGSKGWGYKWRRDLADRIVMRTHTTATSIRHVAKHPNPPAKVFHIGRVFRRETIDRTHLPEFHQVDGIIIDDKASFADLLGTLSEFYKKMGFDKVKFVPDFFPYTEPSVEVQVYFDKLGEWIELGGAGVFRPEVTSPLGCKSPVLAWGLGLERLAMLRYGIKDIRDIYWADIQWLREAPLWL